MTTVEECLNTAVTHPTGSGPGSIRDRILIAAAEGLTPDEIAATLGGMRSYAAHVMNHQRVSLPALLMKVYRQPAYAQSRLDKNEAVAEIIASAWRATIKVKVQR
jgi:hypothetical protein